MWHLFLISVLYFQATFLIAEDTLLQVQSTGLLRDERDSQSTGLLRDERDSDTDPPTALPSNCPKLNKGHLKGLIYVDNCDPKYKAINPYHTMCFKDVAKAVALTQKEKDDVLNKHNEFRSNVSPTATNMQKMIWDDELAVVATKWAQQCRVAHDVNTTAFTIAGETIGQNLAAGHLTIVKAVVAWHNEIKDYTYGSDSIDFFLVGHYTQVVHHKGSRVGCGKALCSFTKYGYFYVCNYALGQGSIKFPYNKGKSCSACKDQCDPAGKLCDCKGKMCLHAGGFLDINTCKCSCKYPYSGPSCEVKICNRLDKWWCKEGPQTNCDRFSSYSWNCPIKCGICPIPCGGKDCLHYGKLDMKTCKCSCKYPFSGDTCEIKKCGRLDKKMCRLNADRINCKQMISFKTDCAIACGVCPKPCDGKKCLNYGTLDPKTCTCKCRYPFTGKMCQTKNCDRPDEYFCKRGKQKTCKEIYSTFPSNCAIFCGICPIPCDGKKCLNYGTLDPKTCTCKCIYPFTGKMCQTKNCNRKVDGYNCGRRYGMNLCIHEAFISTCAIMCGFCPKPCDGKECLNIGRLDTKTCDCKCFYPFSGETCETKNCSRKGDGHGCGTTYGMNYCRFHWSKSHCAVMCGVCPKP